MKVHYVDVESQLKRISRRAYEQGHAIDHVELTLLEASELYEKMPHTPLEESKTAFLLSCRAVYAAPEMDLELRWRTSIDMRRFDEHCAQNAK